MNVLVLHDLDGHEIYINPANVAYVKFPGPRTANTQAVVRLISGEDLAVQETPGAVCYRFLGL